MVKRLSAALAALTMLGTGGATFAASQSPGHRSGSATNAQDAMFAKKAAMGGTAEIALSKVALARSDSKSVKNYAAMMIKDHTVMGAGLMVTAKPLGLATPMVLDAPHRAIKAKLSHLSGSALDSAYLSAMITDHAKTTSLFQKEIAYGKNVHLTNLATKNINAVQSHLQMARDITGTENKPSKIKNPPAM